MPNAARLYAANRQAAIAGQQAVTSAATSIVWQGWNTQYITMATSASTSGNVWIGWNQQYVTASSSVTYVTANVSTDGVWAYWANQSGSTTPIQAYQAPRIDPEQQARWEREAAARRQLKVEADARARRLLLASLTPQQRASYEKDQYFEVHTVRGGQVRKYRLTHGWAGNVFLVDERGRQVERFCIHPSREVPYADNLLAQKLMLETDEERFLRTANKTRLVA